MQYYVERKASGYVGNCLLWWRHNNCGYTCDLKDAKIFEADDPKLKSIFNDEKYRLWDKEYIDYCATRHVDHQNLNMDLAVISLP